MVDALHSDYVRAARLKGLSENRVVYVHALRNALLPTITIVALDVGYVLGGIIVVEEIFAIPGLGRQLIVSIQARDLPMIQAGAVVLASTYAVMNLVADFGYALLDKRIQYGCGPAASRPDTPGCDRACDHRVGVDCRAVRTMARAARPFRDQPAPTLPPAGAGELPRHRPSRPRSAFPRPARCLGDRGDGNHRNARRNPGGIADRVRDPPISVAALTADHAAPSTGCRGARVLLMSLLDRLVLGAGAQTR